MNPRGSPKHTRRPFGRPRVSSDCSRGGFGSLLGLSLGAPGLLWETYWGACGSHLEHLWLMFVSPGGVRSENSEKLEFDDPLNENGMFLKPQGFQHKTKIVPKLANRTKKSREEAKREQRVPWEPSKPAWGRLHAISSAAGGGRSGGGGGTHDKGG